MKSRFSLLAGAVAALCLATPAAHSEPKSIVLANYGGAWAGLLKRVCTDAFTKQTGIEVTQASTGDSLAQIRVQQTTGNVLWDISPTEGAALPVSERSKWLQPIDWKVVDPDNKLPPLAKRPYAMGAIAYSTTLGYRTDKLPAGKTMTGWKDFWDVKGFPGPRSLRDTPIENLEFALIADGVAPAKVYEVLKAPGGIDRAFRKLDEIKPAITVWWTTGQQPVQLLATGDVHYASTFNGRITQLVKDKVPVAMVWNGASLNVSYYSIQKGARNADAAMQFMKFCWNDPQRLAEIARDLPYAGFNPDMYKVLSADEAKILPTAPENVQLQFNFDPEYWADNQKDVSGKVAGMALEVSAAARLDARETAMSQQTRPATARAPKRGFHHGPLLPAALLFLLFFVVPVGDVAFWSVWDNGWTTVQFQRALGEGPYRTILFGTLQLSLVVAVACVVLGYPVAYLLSERPPRQQRLLLLFIMTPLWVSVLIRTYSWIVVLGREGLLNSLFRAVGLTDAPLPLLYNRGAVYAAMVQVLLPIAILTMFSSMSAINRSLLSAARILGASPRRAFIHVFLPLSAGGALSAGVLTFVLALGFFITPALVGGPKDQMIANVIATQISETLDWGFASALGMTLLASGLLIVGIASLGLRRFTFITSEGGTR